MSTLSGHKPQNNWYAHILLLWGCYVHTRPHNYTLTRGIDVHSNLQLLTIIIFTNSRTLLAKIVQRLLESGMGVMPESNKQRYRMVHSFLGGCLYYVRALQHNRQIQKHNCNGRPTQGINLEDYTHKRSMYYNGIHVCPCRAGGVA